MIVLNSTTLKLQLALSAGTADVDVSYNDRTATSYARSDSQQTAAILGTQDICASPGSSTSREIDFVNVQIRTTGGTVTIKKTNSSGSVETVLAVFILAVGETLQYTHARGFVALDSSGNTKEALSIQSNFSAINLLVSGNTTLGDAAADSLTINAGLFSAPNIPAFLATLSAQQSNKTGNSTQYYLIADTEVFDPGANYNNATGIFTAPSTGKYFFAVCFGLDQVALLGYATITIEASNRTLSCQTPTLTNTNQTSSPTFCCMVDMDAADTVKTSITVSGMAGDTVDITTARTFFEGWQVL